MTYLQSISPLWLAFFAAVTASLLLTPLARLLARRLGAVDKPDGQRKLHKQPIPLLGGVAVLLALAASLLVVWLTPLGASPEFVKLAAPLLAAAGFVCLLGCVDDARDLNHRLKLALQCVSLLPIVLAGYTVDRLVIFSYPIELGWLGVPFTMIWLLGCINALNLLDGMDGLASIVGLSTAAMMAVLATSFGHPHVALIAVALSGALLGFLVYNLPPATIYLGDSGSMVIGLAIGILGIQGSLKTTATLAITAPAVMLAVPMLDTVLAVIRRKLTGQSFAAADRGHIHHRLLDRGLSAWQALCIIAALCLATGAAATAATILRSDSIAWIVVVSLMVLMVRLRAFGHHEVALIRERCSAVLQSIAERVDSAHTPDGPINIMRPKDLAFDEAWQLLTEELQHCRGHHLEVQTFTDGDRRGHCRWLGQLEECPDATHWSLILTFGHPESSECLIQVEGRDSASIPAWRMAKLTRLLRAFARHWRDNPREIPFLLPLEQEAHALSSVQERFAA